MAINELKINLLGKIKKPEFQVRRRMLSRILEGELAASSKGKGIEFAGFRDYVYGDDSSLIDWAASLRSKSTLIREYEEYRNFQIFVLLDVSNSMLFSSTDKLKSEYAAELAFSIVYSIVNTGNKIGLGMFTDKLVTRNIPQSGTDNYYRMLDNITKPENYGGQFDLSKVLMQTRALLKEKSLIIVISDFIGLKDNWKNYIRMLTRDFDVMGIMVRDPRDSQMPNDVGQFLVEDPYTNETLLIDSKDYAKVYNERAEEEERKIKSGFQETRAGLISIKTDEDYLQPLLKYFRLRAKMLAKRQ